MSTQHAFLDGEATLHSSHTGFPGPKVVPVRFALVIDQAGQVTVADFQVDPIADIQAQGQQLTLEVSLQPGVQGRYTAADRSLQVDVRLGFAFMALGGWVLAAEAELPLRLGTGAAVRPDGSALAGQAVAGNGQLALVANGVFRSEEASLHGVRCSLELRGRLQPAP